MWSTVLRGAGFGVQEQAAVVAFGDECRIGPALRRGNAAVHLPQQFAASAVLAGKDGEVDFRPCAPVLGVEPPLRSSGIRSRRLLGALPPLGGESREFAFGAFALARRCGALPLRLHVPGGIATGPHDDAHLPAGPTCLERRAARCERI